MHPKHLPAGHGIHLFCKTIAIVCLAFALGCADQNSSAPSQLGPGLNILAIGDSALEWNGDLSTPAQLASKLTMRGFEAKVVNRSVGGATLGCGEQNIGTADNCVPPQYEEQDWDFVLISAGANDILDSDCQLSADELISEDLSSGLMPKLLSQVLSRSKKVLLYGYFLPLDANGMVANCKSIYTLLQRYNSLGQMNDRVTYVDAGQAVQRTSPEYYADDIHPSEAGSAIIADLLADVITRNE